MQLLISNESTCSHYLLYFYLSLVKFSFHNKRLVSVAITVHIVWSLDPLCTNLYKENLGEILFLQVSLLTLDAPETKKLNHTFVVKLKL